MLLGGARVHPVPHDAVGGVHLFLLPLVTLASAHPLSTLSSNPLVCLKMCLLNIYEQRPSFLGIQRWGGLRAVAATLLEVHLDTPNLQSGSCGIRPPSSWVTEPMVFWPSYRVRASLRIG